MSSKKRKNVSFEIPDPKDKLGLAISQISKYQIGEDGLSFHYIKNLKPIFAFDYLSLNKSDLCFNKGTNTKEDLLGFLEGLKKVSSFTYDEMTRTKALRFHSIDLNSKDVTLSCKDFLKILAPSGRVLKEEELPTLYQFDLQYSIEARAVGFLFKGIFHIVWYDRNHIIYPKK